MSDYWTDVKEMADSILDHARECHKEGEEGEGLRESLFTFAHESIDGCSRVIYTKLAQEGLAESPNDGAMVEDFGTDGIVNDGCLNWSAMMYCAMERDVWEFLNKEGFDINNPDDFFDNEEEED